MGKYVQIGVRKDPHTYDRIIEVKDNLGSRLRQVICPNEMIEALVEARFEYALTPHERTKVDYRNNEQITMEAHPIYGAF